jgi:hypothetical protein
VASDSLTALDARERGYARVAVPLAQLQLLDAPADDASAPRAAARAALAALLAHPAASVWLYLPTPGACASPSEDFPIVQTYVDVCVTGCLGWGGDAFASEFLATTHGWSPYFLNDAPASRRPWLHRGPNHGVVDALLAAHGAATRFAERKHPEEFAAAFLTGVRGVWGVPKRNRLFVGRERELRALWRALAAGGTTSGGGGVTRVELVGLGGVGKTQVAIEYAYRHHAGTLPTSALARAPPPDDDADAPPPMNAARTSVTAFPMPVDATASASSATSASTDADGGASSSAFYGLVAWINAETPESIAGDLRRLAADSGVAVGDRPAAEVVEEVKSRLFRAHFPWLLVFDNLEGSAESLNAYLPRGGTRGHVIVTSRRCSAAAASAGGGASGGHAAVRVDCFDAADSVAFLARAAAASAAAPPPTPTASCCDALPDAADAAALADALGHLPLALAMAAAYMRRADVSCGEYAARLAARAALLERDADGCDDYPLSVASSLSLSLSRIAAESRAARDVLDALAYCAPDGIGKPLLRELLRRVRAWPAGADEAEEGAAAVLAAAAVAPMAPAVHVVDAGGDVGAAAAAAGVVVAVAVGAAALSRRMRSADASSSSSSSAGRVALAVSLTTATAGGAAAATLAWRRRARRIATAAAAAAAATPSAHPRASQLLPPSADADADDAGALDDATDAAWALLKTFSLLVVREREASMHRLLQLVIRARHRPHRARRCVAAAAGALRCLWRFAPSDAATWPPTAALCEHVKAIGRAAATHAGCADADAAALLTSAGAFTALALSRFDEAAEVLRDALEAATRASSVAENGASGHNHHRLSIDALLCADACGGGGAAGGADVAPCVSDALFELAKVLRYQGRLGAAAAAATRALAARRAAAEAASSASSSASSAACPRVAAALHELGVCALRSHDPARGEALLREALKAKRAAGSSSSDVAATLHELAVAALNARPPRLDEAEATLRAALAAGGAAAAAGGAGVCAAAATLQQLGRLAMRRGRLADAETALQRAGALARAAYGSERHVNVASCEHQLGLCAAARNDAAAAAAHLGNALRIREAVYAGAPHAELAATHAALGKAARRGGDARRALAHFGAQRRVLDALRREGGSFGAAEGAARANEEPGGGAARARAEMMACLCAARGAARDAGDKAAAAALARDIAALRAAARGGGGGCGGCGGDDASSAAAAAAAAAAASDAFGDGFLAAAASAAAPDALGGAAAAALACRAGVRAELAAAQRAGGRPLDADALRALAAPLRAAVRAAEAAPGAAAAPAVAARAAASAFADTVERCADASASASASSASFASASASSSSPAAAGELRCALFRASDELRVALRAAGVRVEDVVPAAPAAAASSAGAAAADDAKPSSSAAAPPEAA